LRVCLRFDLANKTFGGLMHRITPAKANVIKPAGVAKSFEGGWLRDRAAF
jgi:hypothetical protein